MINLKVYGIYIEGRTLCKSCTKRLYGNSFEMHLTAREIQRITESDRPTSASKGLLCDNCSDWIFQSERTEEPWWLVEPDPDEHLRLLAPFADFLETLKIDAMNLRNLAALGP